MSEDPNKHSINVNAQQAEFLAATGGVSANNEPIVGLSFRLGLDAKHPWKPTAVIVPQTQGYNLLQDLMDLLITDNDSLSRVQGMFNEVVAQKRGPLAPRTRRNGGSQS